MDDTTDGNPLAEVALALAMGFFSIMVLAMVSMAAEHTTKTAASDAPREAIKVELAAANGKSETVAIGEQRVVIFHRGGYLNPDLSPYVPSKAASGPLILAIAPDTSLAASLSARSGLEGREVTMTVLDKAWIKRLKGEEG